MKRLVAIFALLTALTAVPVSAQVGRAFTTAPVADRTEGGDHVFSFEVKNLTGAETRLKGRMVIINVYDTSKPLVIPIEGVVVPGGGTAEISERWTDAPLAGRARVVLVLSDDAVTFVDAYDFWIMPTWYLALAAAAVGLGLLIAAALGARSFMRKTKKRIPAGMVAHTVEFGDTVVSLSNIFGVTWQDIVKANRLKPPYTLKPGSRLLIPKHPLEHPQPKA